MTTIAIDSSVKKQAAVRAKKEKIPLSTVARFLLQDYADGKISLGTRFHSDLFFTPEEEEEILWIQKNDTINGPVSSAQEFLAALKA